ncbi:RNA-binding protein NOB1 [Trypanosoma rangeli]|uniref:RNA-binding protein NOB1 n=1 Tax=Trypanosoma rangeli TaxID=5698 RepID=A0A422N6K6_TRYRA|nr:RNA-binding protein NOB1 [Trypanosoma rangeli]RNF01062.1 RNA-binding protein NOB1 [Trypanosoma rangeli]|eukprot:RNF01062.1 RNA-binding protein NOB1 [Trypanosoma rangeli]
MSWVAAAQKGKCVAPASTEPKRVVFAPAVDVVAGDNDEAGHFGACRTICYGVGATVPTYRKGLLVLDANAFIKGMDNFNDVADALVTTSQVVAEVRDRAARDLLGRLPQALHVLEPSKEALEAVVNVAERTGDLGAMSRTDIRLCALALDCCRATESLMAPIEPRQAIINPGGDHGTEIVTEAVTGDAEEEGEETEVEEEEEEEVEEKKEGDDDDQGWITPENIHKHLQGCEGAVGERFDGGVACVTSDYAMQNTLKHLGVPIVGPHGMRIHELRQWLLRCTSCFALTTDTTRQFCGMCGSGNTLRRVQYVVTRDGKKQLFINFCKPISTRGTIYNLPKPRGGKRGTNRCLVLREDQLAHVIRGTTSAKLKEKHVARGGDGSNDDDLAAFGQAPKPHRRDVNQPRMFSSYHKYNVNEKKKVRASRRK